MMRHLSVFLGLAVLLSSGLARGHAFTPAAVLIEEISPQHYQVSFRRSTTFARTPTALALQLPSACRESGRRSTIEGDQTIDRFELVCPVPLQGQTVRLLGLAELSIGALLHAQFLDGRSVRELLSPRRLSVSIPASNWLADVFFDYAKLGVEHLLTGLDHVLFVVGLLCLVSGLRSILWTLTAFTVGHSVTLGLSALSIVVLPQAPVELGIALSLLVVALQIARQASSVSPNHSVAEPRIPLWQIAGAFGLLHGLGFAGVLAEIGLPEDEIPLSLFAFNVGVELGQVLIVCLTWPVLWMLNHLLREREQRWHRTWRLSAAYLIGSLSGMFCIERVLVLLA